MKKTTILLLAVALVLAVFAGCQPPQPAAPPVPTPEVTPAESPVETPADAPTETPAMPADDVPPFTEENPARAATLAGPTGIGMIKMFGQSEYEIGIYTAPDQLSPKIINGEVDIATIPSNLAAMLYNKTKGAIKVVGINTMGVLYILENGDSVNSLADLAGKTIYATGQAATPEYVLNKILADNGLEDVTVEYMGNHADLANAMAAGDVKLAMLPEPFVSTVLAKNKDISVKVDLNEEWQKIFGEGKGLPMGVTVVSKNFAENKAAMDKLITDYSASVDFVTSDPAGAAAAVAEQKIVPSAAIAESAIPRCAISFITGQEAKSILSEYFTVLMDSNPQSVGGKLPDDAFYYID